MRTNALIFISFPGFNSVNKLGRSLWEKKETNPESQIEHQHLHIPHPIDLVIDA